MQKKQRYRVNEVALVRTLSVVLLLLMLAWIPYMVAKCLQTLEPATNLAPPSELLTTSVFLTYATYALTPVILLLGYRKYRKALFGALFGEKAGHGEDIEGGHDSGIEIAATTI